VELTNIVSFKLCCDASEVICQQGITAACILIFIHLGYDVVYKFAAVKHNQQRTRKQSANQHRAECLHELSDFGNRIYRCFLDEITNRCTSNNARTCRKDYCCCLQLFAHEKVVRVDEQNVSSLHD